MRIALLTYSTRPRGGVVHTINLAEALADLGEDVTLWTLGRGGDTGFFRPVDARVRQVVVPVADHAGEALGERVRRSIQTLRTALDAARRRAPYDVVHAQDCITANAATPCLRTVHHLDVFSTPELVACHERAITEPEALVCVSAAVAGEIAAGWGRPATVIPNGVAWARFRAAAGPARLPARTAWRRRFGAYVLAVGGIEPRKGSLDLLEAWAMLRVRNRDVRLVIAGGETLFDYRDYRAAWDARAVELGVTPVVLGVVAHDDLPSLVAAAGALAFPSTKEGFGLAAMEALAAGTPVVTRDLPVLREVFGPAVRYMHDSASLADQLDQALLVTDPIRQALGERLAAEHTWRAAAQAHQRLYRQLDVGTMAGSA